MFCIKTGEIDSVDDYDDCETIKTVNSIEEAKGFISGKGGDWGGFSAFKGNRPI